MVRIVSRHPWYESLSRLTSLSDVRVSLGGSSVWRGFVSPVLFHRTWRDRSSRRDPFTWPDFLFWMLVNVYGGQGGGFLKMSL